MPRVVPSKITVAAGADQNNPLFLAELNFGTPQYLSSGPQVAVTAGETYAASGLSVGRITQRKGGDASTSISIQNHDDAYSALIDSESVLDVLVDIYLIDGDLSSVTTGDVQHIFSGYIVGADIGDFVDFQLSSSKQNSIFTPTIPLTLFTGYDVVPPGYTIDWGGTRFEVVYKR